MQHFNMPISLIQKYKKKKHSTSTFRSYRNIHPKIWCHLKILMKYICVSFMHIFAYIWQMKTHAIRYYYYFIINQSKTKWNFDRLWKVMLIREKKTKRNEMKWKGKKKEKFTNLSLEYALENGKKSNVYT